MTAQVHSVIDSPSDNVVAFPPRPLVKARTELVVQAHAVIRSAYYQSPADIRTACRHLRDWGVSADHVLAEQTERALNMRLAERAEVMRQAAQQASKRGTIRRELRDTAILLGWFAVLILGLAL